VQQPAEARSLGGVEAPQLSRDAVHEPFMFGPYFLKIQDPALT
jgi:hypothetical protein